MKNAKRIALALVLTLLVGCQTAQPTSAPAVPPTTATTLLSTAAPSPITSTDASTFPMTVRDSVGNEVTIDSEPLRIISLAPSHTEALYALGLGDRVVGVTEYCNYPPEAVDKPKVGEFSTVDLEQIVGLESDLVLATSIHAAEIAPALQDRGIVVFVADPQTVSGVMETILIIGQITGQEETADLLVTQMQKRIDAVQESIEDAPRPKVFWELGPELFTAGPGSFINDLIVLAGGENVAGDADTQWPQLSVEAIILKDPDVIILADHNYGQTVEMVKERPGWEEINAVSENRIIELTDDDITSRPGPRVVEGLEFVARALHPNRFE